MDALATVLGASAVVLAVVGAAWRSALRRRVDPVAVAGEVRAAFAREQAGGEPVRVVVRKNSVLAWVAVLVAGALGAGVAGGAFGEEAPGPVIGVIATVVAAALAALMVWYSGLTFGVAGELTSSGVRFADHHIGPDVDWRDVRRIQFTEGTHGRVHWAQLTFVPRRARLRLDGRFWTPPRRVHVAAEVLLAAHRGAAASHVNAARPPGP